jgi:hypothetical protein
MHRFLKCAAWTGLAAALFAMAPIGRSAPLAAAAIAEDPAAQLDALVERWNKANEDFNTAYRAAKTNDERKAVMEKQPKPAEYLAEFIAVAESAAGTETAAKAWVWAVKLSAQAEDAEAGGAAVDALLRDHVESKEIADLADFRIPIANVVGAEKVEALLRAVVEKSPVPQVKGAYMYALASMLDERGAEHQAEVRKLMETLAKEYADVKNARGRSIGKRAEGWLFEKDNLQVGQTAPEIEGTDLSGVAFKLSDYRGKVVMLDFWGNW